MNAMVPPAAALSLLSWPLTRSAAGVEMIDAASGAWRCLQRNSDCEQLAAPASSPWRESILLAGAEKMRGTIWKIDNYRRAMCGPLARHCVLLPAFHCCRLSRASYLNTERRAGSSSGNVLPTSGAIPRARAILEHRPIETRYARPFLWARATNSESRSQAKRQRRQKMNLLTS